MKRWVLAVDIPGDRAAVLAYAKYHRAVWPEVLRSLRRVGVRAMDIYLLGQRLVMVMDTRDGFDRARDFARHAASDPRCAEWEERMRAFQQAPPGARRGELWALMRPVFSMTGQQRALRAKADAHSPARPTRPAGRRDPGTPRRRSKRRAKAAP